MEGILAGKAHCKPLEATRAVQLSNSVQDSPANIGKASLVGKVYAGIAEEWVRGS